jgi:hypothetical protein
MGVKKRKKTPLARKRASLAAARRRTRANWTGKAPRKRARTKRLDGKRGRATPPAKKTKPGKKYKMEAISFDLLEEAFGPCNKRVRTMVLADLGIISQTQSATGKPRKRSKHVRYLEYDYIRDNVLSLPRVRFYCIGRIKALCGGDGDEHIPWDSYLCAMAAEVDIGIAYETDGIQHRRPVKRFGGVVGFNAQRENDTIKDADCRRAGRFLKRIKNYNDSDLSQWAATRACFEKKCAQKIEEGWQLIISRIYEWLSARNLLPHHRHHSAEQRVVTPPQPPPPPPPPPHVVIVLGSSDSDDDDDDDDDDDGHDGNGTAGAPGVRDALADGGARMDATVARNDALLRTLYPLCK